MMKYHAIIIFLLFAKVVAAQIIVSNNNEWAVVERKDSIKIINVITQKIGYYSISNKSNIGKVVALSNDGNSTVFYNELTGKVSVFDISKMAIEKEQKLIPEVGPSEELGINHVTNVAFNSPYIVVGFDYGEINIWNYIDGNIISTKNQHSGKVTALKFRPFRKQFISGSADGEIKVWELETGKCIRTLYAHTNVINDIDIGFDGNKLVSTCVDKTIKLWNINLGACIDTITTDVAAETVCFRADGAYFVTSGYENFQLWNTKTGLCLNKFSKEESYFSDRYVCYSEGNLLDIVSNDRPLLNPKQLDFNLVDASKYTGVFSKNLINTDIPKTDKTNTETFVLIISNENYKRESQAEYALIDGIVFMEYCTNTLGIDKENVHFIEDATLGKILTELSWLSNITKAYKGDAKIILYYSGHGVPGGVDEATYLLPVDGSSQNLSGAIKLDDVYNTLTQYPTKGVIVFLDACFNGSSRSGDMLASARGTKLKPRENNLPGNMVVFSAATGDETAWDYNDKQHGMFTYFLLKKMQETKGDVTYKDLATYINDNVSKLSIKLNNKPQNPKVKFGDKSINWESNKLN